VCSQVCDSLSAFEFCQGSSNRQAAGKQANAKKGSKPGPGTNGKSCSSKASATPSAASGSTTRYQWCTSEPTVSSLCSTQVNPKKVQAACQHSAHVWGVCVLSGGPSSFKLPPLVPSMCHIQAWCQTTRVGCSNFHCLNRHFGIMSNVSHLLGSKPQAVCLMRACCCR